MLFIFQFLRTDYCKFYLYNGIRCNETKNYDQDSIPLSKLAPMCLTGRFK